MKPWLPRSAESSAGLAARTDCSLAAKHPASAGLLLAAVAGAPSVPSVAQFPETSALGFASERRGAAALRFEFPLSMPRTERGMVDLLALRAQAVELGTCATPSNDLVRLTMVHVEDLFWDAIAIHGIPSNLRSSRRHSFCTDFDFGLSLQKGSPSRRDRTLRTCVFHRYAKQVIPVMARLLRHYLSLVLLNWLVWHAIGCRRLSAWPSDCARTAANDRSWR